jgi:hypothetical protein
VRDAVPSQHAACLWTALATCLWVPITNKAAEIRAPLSLLQLPSRHGFITFCFHSPSHRETYEMTKSWNSLGRGFVRHLCPNGTTKYKLKGLWSHLPELRGESLILITENNLRGSSKFNKRFYHCQTCKSSKWVSNNIWLKLTPLPPQIQLVFKQKLRFPWSNSCPN